MEQEKHYKFLLELMSHAAMFKLKLNEHRGDINRMPVCEAFQRALDEMKELESIFDIDEHDELVADPEQTLLEIADVTNFLLVIAAKAYEAKKGKTVVKFQ